MAVDETVNQRAKRVRSGPAPSDGDVAQRQAMEFVDWDGHRILDMSGPDWNFMVESHRAAARELARASRPHLLRMKWERQDDEVMEFIRDLCHLQREENMRYLCEVCLEASRLRAAHDFKHAKGARDDAVVVRGWSARKVETVVFLTNMDAIRDQAAQAMLRDGWMAQEDLNRVVQDFLQEEGEDSRRRRQLH